MTTRLVVLNGGLRVPSSSKMLADRLTEATVATLHTAGREVEVTTIDLRDHAHAMADAMMTGFPTGALADALEALGSADAVIAVSPTFQASYSGLFKMFIDLVEPGTMTAAPVMLAATGGSERHSLMLEHALRPLFSYLGADPVRTAVYAATSDFGNTHGSELTARIDRAASELATRLTGSAPRPRPSAADEFEANLVPFEQLMARVGR